MKTDPLLTETLSKIKRDYENAILRGGRKEQSSLIRTKKLINLIHEYIKIKLVNNGIETSKIFPPVNQTRGELVMCGLLKEKSQDISILPRKPINGGIVSEGVLKGEIDRLEKNIMSKSISINIRSQLSSLAKNFDTLYERTYAEALNLHLRVPSLVMGEVYMVPLKAYDPDLMKEKKIGWKEKLPLEKYIPAFKYLNNRSLESSEHFKYERVALLIVDFMEDPPKEITSSKYLVKKGYIEPEMSDKLSLEGLSTSNLVSDILEIYKKRHGSLKPFLEDQDTIV
nr:hypothetical protein [uncultured Methanobacterium sp.]